MKRLFFLFLFFTTITLAQNNLVFEQALIVQTGPDAVVPNGKVWKIESSSEGQIYIDGASWILSDSNGKGNLPLWVPEGKTITSNAWYGKISVLEFSVVPISSSGSSSNVGVGAEGFSVSGVFNIELTNNISGYSYSLFGTITVPEGKIWKITKVSSFNTQSPGRHGYVMINGNVFYTRLDQHPSPSPNVYLSAGVHEVYATSSDGNNGSIEAVTINGIEYNSN